MTVVFWYGLKTFEKEYKKLKLNKVRIFDSYAQNAFFFSDIFNLIGFQKCSSRKYWKKARNVEERWCIGYVFPMKRNIFDRAKERNEYMTANITFQADEKQKIILLLLKIRLNKSLPSFHITWLNHLLQSTIVSTFYESLRSAIQKFFHLPPMVPMSNHILADLEVFFESKVILLDIGPKVVEVTLSDLFRTEFWVNSGVTCHFWT